MVEQTHRWGFPLIVPGQAQKEMSHNEALALIDIAVHASVVAVGGNAPPPAPESGACWIVGGAPTGAWAGHADQIAGWTAGGWRFLFPRAGMTVRVENGGVARFSSERTWVVVEPASIQQASGGDVVDSAARSAIASILATLRDNGLLLPD